MQVDNVGEGRQATAFGVLSGIGSATFVCGTLSARFLPTDLTFQVSTLVAVIGAVYMKVFLRDSIIDSSLSAPIITTAKLKNVKIDGQPKSNMKPFSALPSFHELTSLLNSR